jgi:hypothetical protein
MEKTRARILGAAWLLALGGSLLAGCGSASHIDMYFGTDAGADFTQPEREAGLSTDGATSEAGDDAATADGGVD